jgi:hypothetical protein
MSFQRWSSLNVGAHQNFHAAVGRYKAFADLLSSDGCVVIPNQQPFTGDRHAQAQVLVITNATRKPGKSASAPKPNVTASKNGFVMGRRSVRASTSRS